MNFTRKCIQHALINTVPAIAGDYISIKNTTKTLEVLKTRTLFRHLKRFSSVFNGNIAPTTSGDTNSKRLSAIFAQLWAIFE